MNVYDLSSAPELRQSKLNLGESPVANTAIKMLDATTFSRVGFRGKGVSAFLIEQGFVVPSSPNQSVLNDSGILILRLSQTEFWLVDIENSQHGLIQGVELASNKVSDVYRLYCQHSHSCFVLVGDDIPNMFAKVCGVDLSDQSFAVSNIAQTSVARINSIVVRQDIKDVDTYLMFSDLASAQSLWDAIADACEEFN